MFSMTDAVIGLALLAIVIAGVTTFRSDLATSGESRRAAALFHSVHQASEHYLDDRYPHIERCLNGPQWAARWRERQRRFLADPATVTPPPNAGDFVPLPLYPVDVAPVRGDAAWYGDPVGPPAIRALFGVPAAGACLPSLAAAGVLPGALSGLRIEDGDTGSHLYGDRYDLRALVRLVQLDPDPQAFEPVIGIQMLLVMKSPDAEPLSYRSASAIAEHTGLADVGVLASVSVAGVDGESAIFGYGGGWRLDVCVPTAIQLAEDMQATRTHLAVFDTSLATYPGPVPPESILTAASPGLGLPLCASDAVFRDVRTVAIRQGTSDAVVAAFARPASASGQLFERLSGQSLVGDAPPSGRVVALVHRSRSASLRNVLHREAIAGFPELQRMEADVDFGAYGGVNLGYLAGVDTDGDGLVNQGVQIIGPPPPDRWVDGLDPQLGYLPTTFHGPVHFRGPVVIHDGEYPLRGDTRTGGTDERWDNFMSSTLVVSGPTFLDPDPARLLDDATSSVGPVVRTSIDGTTDWSLADPVVDVDDRLFGPGSLRARATSDPLLLAPAQLGSISLLAGSVSLGAFAEPSDPQLPLLAPSTVDVAAGVPSAYLYPGTGLPGDELRGGRSSVAARTLAALDTVDPRAALELFTAGDNAAVVVSTEGRNAALVVGSSAANSPVTVVTFGAESPVQVATASDDSDVQITSQGNDSRIWLRTLLAKSPILLASADAHSPVLVATVGAGSSIDVVTAQPDAPVAVAGAYAPFVLATAAGTGAPSTPLAPPPPPREVPSAATAAALVDVGAWSASTTGRTALAVHTEAALSALDVFTRSPDSPVAVAAAWNDPAAKASESLDASFLDVGVWTTPTVATNPTRALALHTEDVASHIDIYSRAPTSRIAVAAARAAGHASGESGVSSLDLASWGTAASPPGVAVHTEAPGSPVYVYTKDSSSKIVVAAAHPSGKPPVGLTPGSLDIGTWAGTADLAVHTEGASSDIDLFTKNAGARIAVAQGSSSGAQSNSGYAPPSDPRRTVGLQLSTHSADGDINISTASTGSDIVVETVQAASIVIDSQRDSEALPTLAGVHTDPDDFYFRNPAVHIDELSFASALGGTAFPYLPTHDVNDQAEGSAPPCPPGVSSRSIAIPTGWSRSKFAATRAITVSVTVPGHGTQTSTFTVNEPYTGWSSKPVSGEDDGQGATASNTSDSDTDWTRVVLCKTTR